MGKNKIYKNIGPYAKYLFFDLDGPVLDVRKRYYNAYAGAVKYGRKGLLDKEAYWNLKRSKAPDREIIKPGVGLDGYLARRNKLIERKENLELDSVWRILRTVYSKVFLKNPAYLVTLRSRIKNTEWQLNKLGISSWFKRVLVQPSEKKTGDRWKTKVELIRKSGILKNKNVDECIFFGDTETDILAGKHLKMKTAAVAFGIRKREFLVPLKPDFIFDRPKDLADYLKDAYL